jgi:hypothetical protein
MAKRLAGEGSLSVAIFMAGFLTGAAFGVILSYWLPPNDRDAR